MYLNFLWVFGKIQTDIIYFIVHLFDIINEMLSFSVLVHVQVSFSLERFPSWVFITGTLIWLHSFFPDFPKIRV